MKKNIIFMFIGMFIMACISIGVYAINANEITYKETTVDSALDDLYQEANKERIGTTYTNTIYGKARTATMSVSLELNNPGTYLCNVNSSLASGYDTNEFDNNSVNSGITVSGCSNVSNINTSYMGHAAEAKISTNAYYYLTDLRNNVFKCDIDASSTITASFSANPANVVPWSMYISCTKIEY